ncbi:hypothetical protein HMPREF0004_4808 [Achromobacter piechaudii ATCC 43553]|uniref:Hemerythrin-like domain-containing protein n=1 Tax=Achromobacter piechaudii ATCC 43553 TaxID=742159 RepID=D4XH61_9BURK|nr:hypothetical protein HMPREF0004_4808 [Achromobacter piechaudii ATCC 43553]
MRVACMRWCAGWWTSIGGWRHCGRRCGRALSEIAAGRAAALSAEQVQEFTQAYAAHIQREEDELLPMAARLIADDALTAIGQAMKARRGGEAG